jgi:CRISPR-associated endonuclease/helicase Cas3
MDTYFAHSDNEFGEPEPLRAHLNRVAELARSFAGVFGRGDDAYLSGLLHDLGKYGKLFQARLRGEESGLDHWSAGASVCLEPCSNDSAAMVVQGHHIGLQWWDKAEICKLLPGQLGKHLARGKRLTESDRAALLERLAADGITLPDRSSGGPRETASAAAMLDLRMSFSALVDADYLATEEHFDAEAARMRKPAAELRPGEAATVLESYLESVSASGRSSGPVAAMRADLLGACKAAAERVPGLFTLTAPTGSGKTLSTLAFGLRHAMKNGLRRIVVVMPFLSIIDQTARVYREALRDLSGDGAAERYLLEHHSLAAALDGQHSGATLRGMLAENWDAPIVITTSVQFLESLFSNSPAACRKLHRLARSVIVFDEVQTLPLKVVLPTLATLSHLSARYGSSVIFSTATQPAFRHLDGKVRQYCFGGWQPNEIAPPGLRLFERARRVRVEWPQQDERVSWEVLARQIEGTRQVLCIVNLKRHARALFHLLNPARGGGVFHLSTAMCPAHRESVLRTVRERLENGEDCALVATQCVEAGVDLDFPAAFRALAPLDAIAQAAGRCNRNGKLEAGTLRVFVPEDGGYPPGYRQAAELTAALLNRAEGISIDAPECFDEYFRRLYTIASLEDRFLMEAVRAKHFPDVRKYYRIIEQDSVNVLVAYDPERYRELAEEVRRTRLTRDWVRRARPYTVGCFRSEIGPTTMVESVLLKDRTPSGDWYLDLGKTHYDPDTGLVIPTTPEYLEV